MSAADHGRYLGAPDLALTSALIAAGGGAAHFHSRTLIGFLTGHQGRAEVARLQARYGTARTSRFFRTFDAFVDGAVRIVVAQRIALPPASPALTHDPYELAASLRAAGIMPDGRFDIGYMIEHLLSRTMHIALMHEVDADPAIGPGPNADFHVILTRVMRDLKTRDRLPR